MLPPTVPSKSVRPRATPYSVTEVPSTGMLSVADCAACRAGVALAMIRSTPEETKPLVMVAQVAESPCAFWKSKVTFSPKEAVRASSKPCVAASRAACCTNWQMPIVNFWPSAAAEAATEDAGTAEEAAAEDAEEPPQAVRAAAAPQAAAAARNERRVILRIMFISSISLRVRPSGTAPESYVLYARLVQSRFTLVKYITHFTVKQLTFALKRPLLSIVSNISIDYFDVLFRFC